MPQALETFPTRAEAADQACAPVGAVAAGGAAIFALTLLPSSTLLFLLQPMFAKMVLPRLGGAPAVWNTCMVFFQACLLIGYAYAHFSTRWLGAKPQAAVHVVLMAAALAFLPLRLPSGWTPPVETNPVGWLLALLAVSIALP